MLNSLNALLTALAAISLAAERFVTVIKTWLPQLAVEKKTAAGEVDLEADKYRRALVQGIAFVGSYLTVGLMYDSFDPLTRTSVAGDGGITLPIIVVAFLGMGGSSLWTNLLGYTKALKDNKTVSSASNNLFYRQQAADAGVVAQSEGLAIGSRGRAGSNDSLNARTGDALARLQRGTPATLADAIQRGES